ncbi:MAG: DUF4258 domain-containing protein [Chloroflexi bacterium]|nr:DUF4258 domain-containing protein [Chloroflexota bacterium]
MTSLHIGDHARFEMERRHIDEELVLEVARNLAQVIPLRRGRLAYQSRYLDRYEGKEMLLRLVVEQRDEGMHLVTVYKTSGKYWREA